MIGCEIHFLGSREADVDHINAGPAEPVDDRLGQLGAAGATIPPNDNCLGLHHTGKGRANSKRQVGIDRVADFTANIVGSETGRG